MVEAERAGQGKGRALGEDKEAQGPPASQAYGQCLFALAAIDVFVAQVVHRQHVGAQQSGADGEQGASGGEGFSGEPRGAQHSARAKEEKGEDLTEADVAERKGTGGVGEGREDRQGAEREDGPSALVDQPGAQQGGEGEQEGCGAL